MSERENLLQACKTLGVTEVYAASSTEFILDLSKYELLYIRLACNSGKYMSLKRTAKDYTV